MVTLAIEKRTDLSKGATKRMRRLGSIPAVLYGKGAEPQSITVDRPAFEAVLRKTADGHLSTTRFTLEVGGEKIEAVVKGIQYHVTTYDIIHLDFERLSENEVITVKVPLRYEGVAECVGVKLGGVLRQVIRAVTVCCKPKDMPTEFVLNVRKLGVKQSKRVRDITVGAGVRMISKPDEVVVVIAKR